MVFTGFWQGAEETVPAQNALGGVCARRGGNDRSGVLLKYTLSGIKVFPFFSKSEKKTKETEIVKRKKLV